MRNRVFFLVIIAATISIWGCKDRNSISPELAASKEEVTVENSAANVNYVVDYNQFQIVDPGEQFVDENGVLHVRGRLISGSPIGGDLVGMNKRTLLNADIDIASGNGKVFGTYAHEVTWVKRNLKGVLEGRYEAEIVASALSGLRIAPSSDSLMGLKVASTQEMMLPGSMKLKLNSVLVGVSGIEK